MSFAKSRPLNSIIVPGQPTLKSVCRDASLSYGTVVSRIKRGWTREEALAAPLWRGGPRRNLGPRDCRALRHCKVRPGVGGQAVDLVEAAAAAGLKYTTVHTRIHRLRWTEAEALSTPVGGRRGKTTTPPDATDAPQGGGA